MRIIERRKIQVRRQVEYGAAETGRERRVADTRACAYESRLTAVAAGTGSSGSSPVTLPRSLDVHTTDSLPRYPSKLGRCYRPRHQHGRRGETTGGLESKFPITDHRPPHIRRRRGQVQPIAAVFGGHRGGNQSQYPAFDFLLTPNNT
ncbi:hypothetical protein J6590_013915 [Homalodisca vitripennis]|nr:hypothetical protein J6590_013915 [Homalodisca vitripennis]